MVESVTLMLPTDLVERARAEGRRTGKSPEDILAEWTARNGAATTDSLSDDEILAICDSQLPEGEQEQLRELLWQQREGRRKPEDRPRLEGLLSRYRSGLLRKAEALRVAVSRGLRLPLGEP